MPKRPKQSNGRKLVEEAMEVWDEGRKRKPDKEKLKGESADLIYRLFQFLRPFGIFPRHVAAELDQRAEPVEFLRALSSPKRKKRKG